MTGYRDPVTAFDYDTDDFGYDSYEYDVYGYDDQYGYRVPDYFDDEFEVEQKAAESEAIYIEASIAALEARSDARDLLTTSRVTRGPTAENLRNGERMWIAHITFTTGRCRALTVAGDNPRDAFGNLVRNHFVVPSRKLDYGDSTLAYAAGSDSEAQIVVFLATDLDVDDEEPFGT